jgi:mRNA-degrading endonuclease HigB of HigAB toxin-antitoxin module
MFPGREQFFASLDQHQRSSMKVVGLGKLQAFKRVHADAQAQIDAWVRETVSARWSTSREIVARFAAAICVQERRIIFPIQENRYYLDVKISYVNQTVVIIRIGSDADYRSWSS